MSKRRLQKFERYDCSSSDSDEEKPFPRLQKDRDRGTDLPPHLGAEELPEEFGPALPPHLASSQSEQISFGPALPPHLHAAEEPRSIGPALPPHLLNTGEKNESTELDSESFGPALPPHLQARVASTSTEKKPSERLLGPTLPPGFIPPNSSSSDEDDSFGPDPKLMLSGDAGTYNDVDERMERARRKMLEKANKKMERETWMLDLPPERAANLGLGPRQFRAKPAPEMGDRSVWTDTPADKAKKKHLPPKVDDNDLIRKSVIAARDQEMEKMAEKAEKKLKRKESLLDSHTKKLKKDAKDGTNKNDTEGERKRFNRETDMQVNRFDEAQKKAIFKKAQLLNDRFSQGESKYL